MELSQELVQQVLSLSVPERYELAQQMLDSIDDDASAGLDAEFAADLARRREDMLKGRNVVSDWRASLVGIETSCKLK